MIIIITVYTFNMRYENFYERFVLGQSIYFQAGMFDEISTPK